MGCRRGVAVITGCNVAVAVTHGRRVATATDAAVGVCCATTSPLPPSIAICDSAATADDEAITAGAAII